MNIQWNVPSEYPLLQQNEVHVWRANLESISKHLPEFEATLSEDELHRANRFVFSNNRRDYVIARGVLRSLIGRYLGSEPSHVHFHYTKHGKPYVDNLLGGHQFQFNVSHSRQIALYALALDRRVGVDVEYVNPASDYQELAKTVLSPAEQLAFEQVPELLRHLAFYLAWTRKEAFIKAVGEGLSYPLDQFDVSLAPTVPAGLLATRPEQTEARRWSMYNLDVYNLDVDTSYAAALVVETPVEASKFSLQLFCYEEQHSTADQGDDGS